MSFLNGSACPLFLRRAGWWFAVGLFWIGTGGALAQGSPPFERTENVEPCAHYDANRQPFFGALHLHTGRSFDASISYVRATPSDAYAYANGETPLPGVDADGRLTRSYPTPDRPLDFGAVTDHAEYFSVMSICTGDPETPGYYSFECQLLRGFYFQPLTSEQAGAGMVPEVRRGFTSTIFSLMGALVLGASSRNAPLPLCQDGTVDCSVLEKGGIWGEMQAAAATANEPCEFSAFVGYEASSSPAGTTWHRNVIFRNADVVEKPVTAIDMAREPNSDPNTVPASWIPNPDPENLWDALDERCLQAKGNCDVLTIPHNTNLGGGLFDAAGNTIVEPSFFDPPDRQYAAKRQKWEPLVEIYQTKGSSECRFDPRTGQGVQTNDEHCDFELLDRAGAGSDANPANDGGGLTNSSSRSWVRNVLKDGLVFEQDRENFGVNPFKLGIIADSDSHNATMGWHPENEKWGGHAGVKDAIPTQSSAIQDSSGGHAVVWAEENTRDSIFSALRRKETYGTSGTRPIVRFFGGWEFAENLCAGQVVETGYADGVPMGGDLPSRTDGSAAPHFVVEAWMDDLIRTPLDRVQIIKGWVDAEGKTHESVHTVAGGDRAGGVSDTCERTGTGYEHLCSVWHDRHFDPSVPSFYYVRVLENPVCRYSTHICQKTYSINPLLPTCDEELKALSKIDPQKASEAAYCCSNETTSTFVQPVIQERAWTSPIWYTPSVEK